MLDIDCFKNYNDAYGHVAGDGCLRRVAQLLAAAARRPGELAARYGGEEFAVLLPGMDGTAALAFAQAICRALAELGIEHAHSAAAGHVTVSIGVASVDAGSAPGGRPDGAAAPLQLVEAADQPLYASKTGGRARPGDAGAAAEGGGRLARGHPAGLAIALVAPVASRRSVYPAMSHGDSYK